MDAAAGQPFSVAQVQTDWQALLQGMKWRRREAAAQVRWIGVRQASARCATPAGPAVLAVQHGFPSLPSQSLMCSVASLPLSTVCVALPAAAQPLLTEPRSAVLLPAPPLQARPLGLPPSWQRKRDGVQVAQRHADRLQVGVRELAFTHSLVHAFIHSIIHSIQL